MFNNNQKPFELFSILHLLILCFAIISIVILYYFKDKFTNRGTLVFRYTIAASMIFLEITFWIWSISLGGFKLKYMLPLGLCALTMWLTSIALIFDLKTLIKLILPWSFVGMLLSFVVVDMNYAFPHFRFFHYFLNHLLFLLANLFYLFTGKINYSYKEFNKSVVLLIIVASIVFVINLILDTNHMFLKELPDGLNEAFAFIPFPLTTILLVFGIYILMNLFYLIFVYKRSYTMKLT